MRAPSPPKTKREAEAIDILPFHLDLNDQVEKAPSIGHKTAKRLRRVQIVTVSDLLNADAAETALRLNAQHITPDVFRDWQDQARLVCRVPQLRGHDAQILIGCGYRDPLDISTAPTDELVLAATEFTDSQEGKRLVQPGGTPDERDIRNWQSWAGQARELKAA